MSSRDIYSIESDQWPIFVVSLADAYERRACLGAQLQAISMAAEIIDAIDGRCGLLPSMECLIDREQAEARVRRKMTSGEFACALSHQKLYQRILERGLPGAIILEDDAILTPLFADFITQKGYLEADLVQMDYMDARVWRRGHRVFSSSINLAPLAENASLTTGYSISARAARYIFERSQPLAGLADWPCDITPLLPVVTLPAIVNHPDIASSDSTLKHDRNASIHDASLKTTGVSGKRISRFLYLGYWKRWWIKRRSMKL